MELSAIGTGISAPRPPGPCPESTSSGSWLRLHLPHQALAVLVGVDRHHHPHHRPDSPAAGRPRLRRTRPATLRLPTLADVVAYAAANGVELRIHGTKSQVRRPRAHRPGRRALVSGKRKQNTLKPTVVSDGQGPHPVGRGGAPGPRARPDRGQHRGHRRPADPAPWRQRPGRCGLPGAGQGVPRSGPCPPPKPAKDASAELVAAYRQARTEQSSRRICVEHAIAEHKHWRSLQRWLGRRESFGETHLAVAGLVSDRAARR
jgi:hypothetical protein